MYVRVKWKQVNLVEAGTETGKKDALRDHTKAGMNSSHTSQKFALLNARSRLAIRLRNAFWRKKN